jgi:hypothetical protein
MGDIVTALCISIVKQIFDQKWSGDYMLCSLKTDASIFEDILPSEYPNK